MVESDDEQDAFDAAWDPSFLLRATTLGRMAGHLPTDLDDDRAAFERFLSG